jgi:hypothetical protein
MPVSYNPSQTVHPLSLLYATDSAKSSLSQRPF